MSAGEIPEKPGVESLSAVTLATGCMPKAVRFYEALGFSVKFGGPDAHFTSFSLANTALNLIEDGKGLHDWWGRVIFYVNDVDGMYRKAVAAGLEPLTEPRDGEWGERYFHILDPDGHELSLARPIGQNRP